MKDQTRREMLLSSLTMGGIFALVMLIWTNDPLQVLFTAPFFAAMMYLSYSLTNRVARRFRPRVQVEEHTEPPEPSSERPEHAQRRRARRRRRSRRDTGTRSSRGG